MLDLAKRTVLVAGILLMGVAVAKAFTLTDGSSGSLSQTVVNNLGEEYRWNSPVLTYSYDESFLNYFLKNNHQIVDSSRNLRRFINASFVKN